MFPDLSGVARFFPFFAINASPVGSVRRPCQRSWTSQGRRCRDRLQAPRSTPSSCQQRHCTDTAHPGGKIYTCKSTAKIAGKMLFPGRPKALFGVKAGRASRDHVTSSIAFMNFFCMSHGSLVTDRWVTNGN